jgi:hypothetical protein
VKETEEIGESLLATRSHDGNQTLSLRQST